ncbi:MAG: hypothetical protein PWP15_1584 [Methanothermococcus sp.]|jgi:SAM-dependent methyltransferase|uniref:class I SAM-dependent methyltransferase n=1 Tax=Methanothermococcus TaxID=155862 RepID=UPI00037244FF|nr:MULTISPECIES: class I SAM-dependent methyltransferase [Methanothermococcus]MDK2791064.1 hypothetical protein [Methanothermococcus sp.]MDK2988241.1 hypothetical protein [Methanothermococcus sp.]
MNMNNTNKGNNGSVRDFYDNWNVEEFPDYLKLIMEFEEQLIFDILSNMDVLNNNSKTDKLVLDCGCGFGSFYPLIKDFNTIYMDFSLNLLKKFKINTNKVCGDIQNLPFKDNTFDLVLCINVLEHVDFERAVNEIKRVLKTNGTCIFVVVNRDSIINEEIFTDWKITHNSLSIDDFKDFEYNDGKFLIKYWRSFYFVHPIFKVFPKFILKRILNIFYKLDKLGETNILRRKGQFLMVAMVKK